ncbi:hypothetical protein AMST5_00704 [freshwater sediment metagenome]|uniref:Uncharacterized protein n=1 Tax=freshwater sediment metagenome TaxID=556182 RepID=A0AA48LYT2_9ZZZZ
MLPLTVVVFDPAAAGGCCVRLTFDFDKLRLLALCSWLLCASATPAGVAIEGVITSRNNKDMRNILISPQTANHLLSLNGRRWKWLHSIQRRPLRLLLRFRQPARARLIVARNVTAGPSAPRRWPMVNKKAGGSAGRLRRQDRTTSRTPVLGRTARSEVQLYSSHEVSYSPGFRESSFWRDQPKERRHCNVTGSQSFSGSDSLAKRIQAASAFFSSSAAARRFA